MRLNSATFIFMWHKAGVLFDFSRVFYCIKSLFDQAMFKNIATLSVIILNFFEKMQ